jgi:prepilin-type N-terminal cleavage/methylation domain-containing protein
MEPKMTSSLPHKSRSRAFTLVEILVVVGIIVLLATIALPMMSRAYAQSKRVQMAADLQVISQALEAYRADFGDYPRRRNADVDGAALLCWALVAPGPASSGNGVPGDGADGPGFRIRGTTGTVKGPYLSPDRFTIGTILAMGSIPAQPVQVVAATTFDDSQDVLADRFFHPILYFPANKGADPSNKSVAGGAFVNSNVDPSPQAVFNFADLHSKTFHTGPGIDVLPNKMTAKTMAFRLGNIDGSGTLASSDTPSATGPYLLWSPGPDGYYGTTDDVADNGTSIQLNTAPLPSNFP